MEKYDINLKPVLDSIAAGNVSSRGCKLSAVASSFFHQVCEFFTARVILQGRNTDLPLWTLAYICGSLAGNKYDWASFVSERLLFQMNNIQSKESTLEVNFYGCHYLLALYYASYHNVLYDTKIEAPVSNLECIVRFTMSERDVNQATLNRRRHQEVGKRLHMNEDCGDTEAADEEGEEETPVTVSDEEEGGVDSQRNEGVTPSKTINMTSPNTRMRGQLRTLGTQTRKKQKIQQAEQEVNVATLNSPRALRMRYPAGTQNPVTPSISNPAMPPPKSSIAQKFATQQRSGTPRQPALSGAHRTGSPFIRREGASSEFASPEMSGPVPRAINADFFPDFPSFSGTTSKYADLSKLSLPDIPDLPDDADIADVSNQPSTDFSQNDASTDNVSANLSDSLNHLVADECSANLHLVETNLEFLKKWEIRAKVLSRKIMAKCNERLIRFQQSRKLIGVPNKVDSLLESVEKRHRCCIQST